MSKARAKALWAYSPPADANGVALVEGEEVDVLDRSGGEWWWVRRAQNDQEGYVPANYLEVTQAPARSVSFRVAGPQGNKILELQARCGFVDETSTPTAPTEGSSGAPDADADDADDPELAKALSDSASASASNSDTTSKAKTLARLRAARLARTKSAPSAASAAALVAAALPAAPASPPPAAPLSRPPATPPSSSSSSSPVASPLYRSPAPVATALAAPIRTSPTPSETSAGAAAAPTVPVGVATGASDARNPTLSRPTRSVRVPSRYASSATTSATTSAAEVSGRPTLEAALDGLSDDRQRVSALMTLMQQRDQELADAREQIRLLLLDNDTLKSALVEQNRSQAQPHRAGSGDELALETGAEPSRRGMTLALMKCPCTLL